MRPLPSALASAALLAIAGCQANHAPGNDTEARLDPPPPPPRHASAGEILATVALDELQPEPLEGGDVPAAGAASSGCRFLLTLDSAPSFVYGRTAGTLRFNETLVTLPASGAGRFAADGLAVTVASLSQAGRAAGERLRPAQMVIRMAKNPQERGYRGYLACDAGN